VSVLLRNWYQVLARICRVTLAPLFLAGKTLFLITVVGVVLLFLPNPHSCLLAFFVAAILLVFYSRIAKAG